MSTDEHAEKLAHIERIVARVDSRFEVVETPEGDILVQVSEFPSNFLASEYESGDYEAVVRKLVRELAAGMYEGSMFTTLLDKGTLTL